MQKNAPTALAPTGVPRFAPTISTGVPRLIGRPDFAAGKPAKALSRRQILGEEVFVASKESSRDEATEVDRLLAQGKRAFPAPSTKAIDSKVQCPVLVNPPLTRSSCGSSKLLRTVFL